MWKRILIVVVAAAALALTTVAVQAAAGTGPADALSPNGAVQTVPPQAVLWYAFDVGGHKRPAAAYLDAASADGLRFAIYTPDAVASWGRGDKLQAVGFGSSQQTHTLGWFGSFNQAGRYYAVVYNDTGAPVQVKVTVEGDAIASAPQPTPTLRADPLVTPTALGKGIAGKLAFVDATGGNVYTVNGDGTQLQRVSFGMDPQWNHAGTQLALARQGPVPGIFTINADGSNARLLYKTNEPRSPDWQLDDSEVVFSYQGATKGGGERCFRNRCFQLPSTTQWQLGGVTMADGAFHDVRSSTNATTPTVNANGSTIAYNDGSLGLMRTTWTGAPEADPFIGDLRITSRAYNPLRLVSPQYSPDGKKIVYMVMQQPTWQIAIANADGSDQHLLTSDFALWLNHPSNVAPVWSPDGKQILFLSNRNGKWEFFVMNADGSNVQQVLKNVTDQVNIQYDFQAGRMMSWTR